LSCGFRLMTERSLPPVVLPLKTWFWQPPKLTRLPVSRPPHTVQVPCSLGFGQEPRQRSTFSLEGRPQPGQFAPRAVAQRERWPLAQWLTTEPRSLHSEHRRLMERVPFLLPKPVPPVLLLCAGFVSNLKGA